MEAGRRLPPSQRPGHPSSESPYLPHRGLRGAALCASSPSSSSAGASGPSWTPRGFSRQTPAGGQSVECTGRGLQQTNASVHSLDQQQPCHRAAQPSSGPSSPVFPLHRSLSPPPLGLAAALTLSWGPSLHGPPPQPAGCCRWHRAGGQCRSCVWGEACRPTHNTCCFLWHFMGYK